MRIEIQLENKRVALGLDRVTGAFIQIINENGVYNWSEFYPFQKRLTCESLKEIKKLLTKEEYKQVLETKLIEDGYWGVYFSGICTTKEVNESFEYPKRLIKHVYDGKEFRIRTLGDYFKALKCFQEPVTFWHVNWYDGIDNKYTLYNDHTEQIFEQSC